MTKRNFIAFLVFLLVGLLLVFASPDATRGVQMAVLHAVAPLLGNGTEMRRNVLGIIEGIETLEELQTANHALQVENERLLIENQALRDIKKDNDRLREMLGFTQRSLFELVPAEVISRDPQNWWNSISISRGTVDGLTTNLPVLTQDGVVGKTVWVGEREARVLLLTDPNCKIAARVEGTQEQGILTGTRMGEDGRPIVTLEFLSRELNLQPGLRVYTSGIGGVFPPNILLGVVESYDSGPMHGSALVRPEVDLSRVDNVFVVIGEKK
jgi:rod shape-determining protein MreC